MSALEILTWILGGAGGLGIVGAIVAIVVTGGAALPVIEGIAATILRCHPCLAVLAIVLAVLGGYWYGRHEAQATCRAEELAAELRNREIDVEQQSKARSDETERANRIAADAEQRAKDDADYIAHLKSRVGCQFDDGDVGVQQPAGRARGAGAARGSR